jgi:hypothetical protein
MPPVPGLQATVEHTSTAADTALAVGSGDVAVLATPRLLALAEARRWQPYAAIWTRHDDGRDRRDARAHAGDTGRRTGPGDG